MGLHVEIQYTLHGNFIMAWTCMWRYNRPIIRNRGSLLDGTWCVMVCTYCHLISTRQIIIIPVCVATGGIVFHLTNGKCLTCLSPTQPEEVSPFLVDGKGGSFPRRSMAYSHIQPTQCPHHYLRSIRPEEHTT